MSTLDMSNTDKLRIVYVDDEIEICECIRDEFSSDKVHIDIFTSSQEAVIYINNNPPDLVFTDNRMPKMTGEQMAEKITAKIPVVLITGDLDHKPKFAFASILPKPFEFSEIHKIITDLLKNKK